jgi:hypothetical protein
MFLDKLQVMQRVVLRERQMDEAVDDPRAVDVKQEVPPMANGQFHFKFNIMYL